MTSSRAVRTAKTAMAVLLAAGLPVRAAPVPRIDLAEFGRVVEMPEGPARETTSTDELIRGAEGWEPVRGVNGQYTIGVQWDEPRELSEVNIEFRHAIANREQIKVQYWKPESPDTASQETTAGPQAAKGKWLTPKTEWWAGDRDVSFSFLPDDLETADRNQPGKPTRCTTRLRFVCGQEDLPPVRYLRTYGPQPTASDTFDVRIEKTGQLAPPVSVRAVNGFIMAGDGKTKMTSAILRATSNPMLIRYGRTDPSSPNRTQLIFTPVDQPEEEKIIFPAEAARRGRVRLDEAGLVVERRGGKTTEPRAADSAPAAPATTR